MPKTGRPQTTGGKPITVYLPAHVREYLKTNGASHTITKLVEEKMNTKINPANEIEYPDYDMDGSIFQSMPAPDPEEEAYYEACYEDLRNSMGFAEDPESFLP
jgi:hypothetical protein